ncbi:sensor histidine kinase [Xanthobacter versatilis]|uniref:sensor histidine kinase n=1 Tax=Xanthobacter autotrophicus (strain ATCC BAA-1158 / Py2) TaxID=78245 RepID=UPI00372B6640
MHRIFKTTAFRWAFAIALWSSALSLALLAFVYWRTVTFAREQLDHLVIHEARFAAAVPAEAAGRLQMWLQEDLHSVRFAGLFAADGRPLAGNLGYAPADLPDDGAARRVNMAVQLGGQTIAEELRAVALRLDDGRQLVVAHDLDEIQRGRSIVLRALALAVGPMLLLSVVGGIMLAAQARRRLSEVEAVLAKLMRGDLRHRLPVNGTGDEFDRLSAGVNALLAEIERLMDEVRGVGDSIAHDLRTPLTRLRARLECSRDGARSVEEFQQAIDQALVWLDQTLSLITAVLRIGEIEHERRRAAFHPFDLAPVLREVAELYEPTAEEKAIRLTLDIAARDAVIIGDCDLMLEAVANLVDNAVKFTPAGGEVRLGLGERGGAPVIIVEDTGPGIPPEERAQVFKRFYRSAPERHGEGNGLGLSIVAAIAGLHDYIVSVAETAGGGCRFELVCHRSPAGDRGDPARWAPERSSGGANDGLLGCRSTPS